MKRKRTTRSDTGISTRPGISRTSSGRGSVHSTKSSAVTERRKHDEQSKNRVTRQEGRPRILTCRDDLSIFSTACPLYLLFLLFPGILPWITSKKNPCHNGPRVFSVSLASATRLSLGDPWLSVPRLLVVWLYRLHIQ